MGKRRQHRQKPDDQTSGRSPGTRTSPEAALLPRRGSRLVLAALVLLVGLVVAGVHWPALSARALTFDDQDFLTHNHLVRHPSWASAGQFLAEVLEPSTVKGYYMPLSMISLMLDYAAGGRPDNLLPFHRTSLALHLATTALLIILLALLLGRPWPAALAGLLFGLHPLTVEPIVWVGERKTMLATFFSLACLLSYVVHARRSSRLWYAGSLLSFVLALLSKPTSVPLPVCLLLLNYWPLRRLSRRVLLELVPFFAVGAAFAAVAVLSHARTVGLALPGAPALPNPFLLTPYLLVFYLRKIVWPTGLAPYYELPRPFVWWQPAVLAGLIGTALFFGLLLWSWRRTRAALTGGLIFLVALSPTLGLVHYSWVVAADKYVYLPAVGLLLILARCISRIWTKTDRPLPSRLGRTGILVLIATISTLAASATRSQIARWQTTERLCRYILSLSPQAAPIHDDLATELTREGRIEEALEHYRLALQADPGYYRSYNNLGIALMELGRFQEAIEHFRKALELKPDYGSAYNSLGTALARQERIDEAYLYFQKALELDPHIADIHSNLAGVLARRGDLAGAVQHYREALRLKPEFAGAHYNLGLVLASMGQFGSAEDHFRVAIRLNSSDPSAYAGLARVLLTQGKTEQAIRAFEDALRLAPGRADLQAGLEAARAHQRAERVGPE